MASAADWWSAIGPLDLIDAAARRATPFLQVDGVILIGGIARELECGVEREPAVGPASVLNRELQRPASLCFWRRQLAPALPEAEAQGADQKRKKNNKSQLARRALSSHPAPSNHQPDGEQ